MIINGKAFSADGERSLVRVLEAAGYDAGAVVCEVNRNLVRRADMQDYLVEDDDIVEVFSFTGGG
ncbi:sulfur carrier protein ThiS [Aedoeadaptatus ivorii]|uniref:Sulfur carrier protein ThiS n=1 Tax=Aedoeadaptatus ivorii TaxID=54006 RepID=A0A448V2X6_9FIRM|nr:sulfur carrier protein ThiS [Peptoniphilus ivorii]MDQ0508725.1 sulfur carrier protein [Peptoniphilus ivorii]VEJ36148.1 sulfur carrier protein ThiS [Peptoniphilus ivorii]